MYEREGQEHKDTHRLKQRNPIWDRNNISGAISNSTMLSMANQMQTEQHNVRFPSDCGNASNAEVVQCIRIKINRSPEGSVDYDLFKQLRDVPVSRINREETNKPADAGLESSMAADDTRDIAVEGLGENEDIVLEGHGTYADEEARYAYAMEDLPVDVLADRLCHLIQSAGYDKEKHWKGRVVLMGCGTKGVVGEMAARLESMLEYRPDVIGTLDCIGYGTDMANEKFAAYGLDTRTFAERNPGNEGAQIAAVYLGGFADGLLGLGAHSAGWQMLTISGFVPSGGLVNPSNEEETEDEMKDETEDEEFKALMLEAQQVVEQEAKTAADKLVPKVLTDLNKIDELTAEIEQLIDDQNQRDFFTYMGKIKTDVKGKSRELETLIADIEEAFVTNIANFPMILQNCREFRQQAERINGSEDAQGIPLSQLCDAKEKLDEIGDILKELKGTNALLLQVRSVLYLLYNTRIDFDNPNDRYSSISSAPAQSI